MRTRPALIASALLAGLALGCNTEPAYNTLAETPPGGDAPAQRPAVAGGGRSKVKAPKTPAAAKAGRKAVDVDDTKPVAGAPAPGPRLTPSAPRR